DGIRDGHVTGVQTCALPISAVKLNARVPGFNCLFLVVLIAILSALASLGPVAAPAVLMKSTAACSEWLRQRRQITSRFSHGHVEIGRASCRESVALLMGDDG